MNLKIAMGVIAFIKQPRVPSQFSYSPLPATPRPPIPSVRGVAPLAARTVRYGKQTASFVVTDCGGV